MYRFYISILFLLVCGITLSQNEQQPDPYETVEVDSSYYKKSYGLRIGVDISKPIRSFLTDGYQGFELIADYRISQDLFIAAEIGNEEKLSDQNAITTFTKGSYITAGVDYNAYENWFGEDNLLYGGLRLGYSTFSTELREYTFYTGDDTFQSPLIQTSEENSGLNAIWIGLRLGVKVEIIDNLYMGAWAGINYLVTEDSPNRIDNLYIPGFGRTYDFSSFGAGWGYTVSYLIPLYSK